MILEEEIYLTSVTKILKEVNENLDPDLSMIEKQIAKENIMRAKETENSVLSFIEKHTNELIKFSVLKLKLISDEDEDDNEEDEELGVSKTFLIDYSLELMLIKKGEFYLENYLKKLRIPNLEKYAEELRDIYIQL